VRRGFFGSLAMKSVPVDQHWLAAVASRLKSRPKRSRVAIQAAPGFCGSTATLKIANGSDRSTNSRFALVAPAIPPAP